MLWSDRMMEIENGIDAEEKRRWNKTVKLSQIKDVSVVNDKQERKFSVSIKGKKRQYIWRCDTKFARDTWMSILEQHIQYSKQESMYNTPPV